MVTTNVYISDEGNLKLLMHDDFTGFTFTVTNDDDSAYDFTGFTDVFLKIYTEQRGKLLKTIPEHATNGVSISSNIVSWSATYADDIAIFNAKTYHFELSYLDANSKLITIIFGDFTII